MRKTLLTAVLSLIVLTAGFGQKKRVKNVILMIPDGTSWATVSSARWYQRYIDPSKPHLFLDPYICGSVLTFSSNAPIGDSAPTTSCYMTGTPSREGFVSTYPPADAENDIVPLDSAMAYQPMMTVLEAAKIFNKMSTGLVFTCEFPHATPADCSAHSYNRNKYEWIAPQMIHNNIDVVIGGGAKYLDEESKNYLKNEGYGVYTNDLKGFRSYQGNKMWSLFCDVDMPYDIDNDTLVNPSLSEMTAKAIEKLSKNENGFFLMVEGSKVDWAAHSNDPIGMITEMLAFDKAFGVAVDFAKKNGETVVIAVPDHGNSGISIGDKRCADYSHLSKNDLFKNISKYKTSADKLVSILKQTEPANIRDVFKKYTDIDLSDSLVRIILASEDYGKSTLSLTERMKGSRLKKTIGEIMTGNTCFGFTTGGHTGEEVFLAIYAPENNRVTGMITNTELNQYMQDILSINNLKKHTSDYFAKHTEVFKNYKYKINSDNEKKPVLEVVKDKKNKLTITPNTNIVLLNGKEIKLNSVVVYVDKTKTFYLPRMDVMNYELFNH
ncbi:MAG: alkaline phosphatase [Prevotellaceae bacterium]|jgi:alkaline phosphatase|nr:alkaline phosphatase [Prevotellaceae bacterium]